MPVLLCTDFYTLSRKIFALFCFFGLAVDGCFIRRREDSDPGRKLPLEVLRRVPLFDEGKQLPFLVLFCSVLFCSVLFCHTPALKFESLPFPKTVVAIDNIH